MPSRAGGTIEVRFERGARDRPRAHADAVQIGDETDAFEDVIPVEVLASPETVAAYGEAGRAQGRPRES